VPIGWLLRHNCRPTIFAMVWVLSLIPIIASFTHWLVPNTMSLAAIGCLYALHIETRAGQSTKDKAVEAIPATGCN
jgi:hypothetical protein